MKLKLTDGLILGWINPWMDYSSSCVPDAVMEFPLVVFTFRSAESAFSEATNDIVYEHFIPQMV